MLPNISNTERVSISSWLVIEIRRGVEEVRNDGRPGAEVERTLDVPSHDSDEARQSDC